MEVDWDKHLREETNAYLDKQDFLEYLDLSEQEILIRMGAE